MSKDEIQRILKWGGGSDGVGRVKTRNAGEIQAVRELLHRKQKIYRIRILDDFWIVYGSVK